MLKHLLNTLLLEMLHMSNKTESAKNLRLQHHCDEAIQESYFVTMEETGTSHAKFNEKFIMSRRPTRLSLMLFSKSRECA